MSGLRTRITIAEAVTRGFTHLQVRCGAPKGEGGYCGNITCIPWDLLPPGLVARNPWIDEFRPLLRCRKCGLKGWGQVEAWRQEGPG